MLIKRLRYSGAYKMFMWLAKQLADSGHDVTVMTFMPNDVESLSGNITWIKKDDLEHKNILKKIYCIRKEIDRINPDVSISFLLDANVYNIFACLGLKTKSVVCERNDPFKPGYKALKFWKSWFRFADGAVYQLPKVAEYYNNIKSPTAIIPNPVLCKSDIEIKSFKNRDDKICVLGRYDIFQKRHDILIQAFNIFAKKHPEYKLYFYGDGPDADKMRNLIKELNLKHSVILAGVTNNPQEVLTSSKMYVMTSDFEGIPNSLIEAMSIGLPCISTDCRPGGAALLIEDGVNGFLVPQGDYKFIAEKMLWLCDNPDKADDIGNKAKEISNRFSEEVITAEWIKYLKSICK